MVNQFIGKEDMRLKGFLLVLGLMVFVIAACSHQGSENSEKGKTAGNKILQQEDGTIALDLRKAFCYSNSEDPSSNTAEWNFVLSKTGRYKVWLTSATVDTLNLNYKTSVKILMGDERLDVKPVGDKIVLNTGDVSDPYFRADSYMGSFYFQHTGEYTIQVVSEKVVPQVKAKEEGSTKLMSVILTPMTR